MKADNFETKTWKKYSFDTASGRVSYRIWVLQFIHANGMERGQQYWPFVYIRLKCVFLNTCMFFTQGKLKRWIPDPELILSWKGQRAAHTARMCLSTPLYKHSLDDETKCCWSRALVHYKSIQLSCYVCILQLRVHLPVKDQRAVSKVTGINLQLSCPINSHLHL